MPVGQVGPVKLRAVTIRPTRPSAISSWAFTIGLNQRRQKPVIPMRPRDSTASSKAGMPSRLEDTGFSMKMWIPRRASSSAGAR